jgi:hypothetical protein
MSGGPSRPEGRASAVTGGQSAGEQSGSGGPQGVTSSGSAAATRGQPAGDAATGNLTTGGQNGNPPNGGLAKVFAGQPAETAPDQGGSAPRGNRGPAQSNETTTTSQLPEWTEQLSKKARSDFGERLAGFKSLDEFVQASLDAQAKAPGENRPALPGESASPEEAQAFYERLGKPPEAAGYRFAKNDPDFARVAFETNLTAAQAEALYSESLARTDDARNGIQAALARDYQTTDALLQKEFGERYDEAIALFQRGMGNNPQTGELSPLAQSLIASGLAGKPEIVRAFIELGRATSEGSAAGGFSGAGRPDSVMRGRGFGYKDSYDKE